LDFLNFGIIFVMSNYSLIEIVSFKKVTFYSVKEIYADEELIWFSDFIKKIENEEKISIREMLKMIGNKYEAGEQFFRHEGQAQALPSKKVNFIEIKSNLRLYCLRINNNAVILFNGGYKDAQKAQDSKISFHFQQANMISKKILKSINNKSIIVGNDNRLKWDQDLII